MEQTIENTSDLILPTSRDSQFKTMTLEPGMTLVRAGQPLLGLITVVKGRLKRKRPYPAGEFLVGIAGPGERIGLIELLTNMRRTDALGHELRHVETLEAIGHVEVQIEPATVVEVRLRALPQEIRRILADMAAGHREPVTKGVGESGSGSTRLRRPLDLMPVKARVAATLWQLMEAHGVRVADVVLLDLDLTREEIAHLAGTVYESVIRMLTKFKNDGLIKLEGRKILIKDETLLARTAQVVLDRPEIQPENRPESPLASSQFQTGVERHDSRSDKEAVVQNHSSKNNGRSKEAS
ncbi:MAG: Crp/Fnr family transcriptional regulator [Bdellovibrionales bacterium]|nr:Crp/Fnr family transcriptional regulator [Bdellovibrionales bacterium]